MALALPPAGAQEKAGHAAYMAGQNGFFMPDRFCTRAEIAQILSNLTDSAYSDGRTYSDVPAGSWYAASVGKMGSLIAGYSDGTFRPYRYVTLAELVTILARLYSVTGTSCTYTDVAPGNWWYGAFAAAEERGWLTPDFSGRCYPMQKVTRAQAAVIINRADGRRPDQNAIDSLGKTIFLDVPESRPDYYDIIEAGYSHECLVSQDAESWSGDYRPADKPAGAFRTVDGALYYYQDDGTVYTTPGLLTVGGNSYLVSSDAGRIVCDGAVHEFMGSCVFCTAEGPILKNDQQNGFRFGANGFYTSGDTELDGLVSAAIASCTTSAMTPLQKLRACYDRVRGFQYLGRNGVQSGKTLPAATAAGFAKVMLKTGKGDCYNYASAFSALARQLGFDVRVVVGRCSYVWNTYAIPHGWTQLTEDGKTYLFDAEIENYNIRHGISNETRGAFMVPYAAAPANYIPN